MSECSAAKQAVDCGGENWMASLNDVLKLSEVNIPGTHDSCAYSGYVFGRCQRLSLIDQLHAGVRFLDVRCRHANDKFKLHHSSFYLGDHFDSGVVEPCVRFLQRNTSEVILMLVKPEYKEKNNTSEFDERFLEYIRPNKEFWYLHDGHDMPTLSQTRGKIVLLRRFVILLCISFIYKRK